MPQYAIPQVGSCFSAALNPATGGDNWAERCDASLNEVLSKLAQVTTVVANGTFGESTFTAQILSKPRNR